MNYKRMNEKTLNSELHYQLTRFQRGMVMLKWKSILIPDPFPFISNQMLIHGIQEAEREIEKIDSEMDRRSIP